MNPPGPFSCLIGNVILAPFLMLVSGLVIRQWWQGGASPMAAIIAFAVASSAAQSMVRVQSYRDWKRRWDAMGDAPPRRSFAQWLWRIPAIRLLAIGLVWFAALSVDSVHQNDPAVHFSCLLVVVGLPLGLVGRWLLRYRRGRRARQAARNAEAPVSLQLPLPRSSPSRNDAVLALPDHCKRLMG